MESNKELKDIEVFEEGFILFFAIIIWVLGVLIFGLPFGPLGGTRSTPLVLNKLNTVHITSQVHTKTIDSNRHLHEHVCN